MGFSACRFPRRSALGRLLGIVLATSGCVPSAEYDTQVMLPSEGWKERTAAVFRFHNQDSITPCRLWLQIRHEGDYPYRNLHAICLVTGPAGDSSVWNSDIPLTDSEGRWIGQSALGDLYTVVVPVQDRLVLRRKGNYTFRVMQNMRLSPLPSVMEVGWKIDRVESTD